MNLQKITFIILLPLIIWQLDCGSCVAQQKSHNDEREYFHEALKDIPELPNLPLRQIATKFNSGVVYPAASGGPTYIIFLSSRQSISQLTTAYQQLLSSAGWKIRQEYLSKGEVEGNHPNG